MTDGERAINDRLASMEKRLFGEDGEGGKFRTLEDRLRSLENWRWWLLGAAAVIAAPGIGRALAEALTK